MICWRNLCVRISVGDNLNFGLPYEGCTNRDTIEIIEITNYGVIFDADCFDQNTEVFLHPPNEI